MKHYFLGMAAGYNQGRWLRHLFTVGLEKDCRELRRFLSKRYAGEAILCKNGRSALALALKAYFNPGERVLVNGFTCYAVYEAVVKAGLKPVFADISLSNLNFTASTLEKAFLNHSTGADSVQPITGIIVQNTLGNPVDIEAVSEFAERNGLKIIEDLAHSAGIRYADGREAGTVGIASVWSFGKDKSVDTISGGALVLRSPCLHEIRAPFKTPKLSDHLRVKFYPKFGALCRTLSYVGLGGALMRLLVAIHWVEKSADNRLSLEERPSKFEAKLALKQFEGFHKNGEGTLRDYCFVRDREELLVKLQKKGFYFGGFWYEKPVSPSRYYKKVGFPEDLCPNAVYASEHILNLPKNYLMSDINPARKIIKEYVEEVGND